MALYQPKQHLLKVTQEKNEEYYIKSTTSIWVDAGEYLMLYLKETNAACTLTIIEYEVLDENNESIPRELTLIQKVDWDHKEDPSHRVIVKVFKYIGGQKVYLGSTNNNSDDADIDKKE